MKEKMGKELTLVDGKLISTLDISRKFDIEHRRFMQHIRKNLDELRAIGLVEKAQEPQDRGGWPTEFYFIDDQVAFHLMISMSNAGNIKLFKNWVREEFNRLKSNSNTAEKERLEAREQGKIARSWQTDAIQEFIEYRIKEGSDPKHLSNHYASITSMLYKSVIEDMGKKECKKVKDKVNAYTLRRIEEGETLIASVLMEGILEGLTGMQIYQKMKDKIQSWADILGLIPKIIASDKTVPYFEIQKKICSTRLENKKIAMKG